jgi:ABC-2 type transport system permease protein
VLFNPDTRSANFFVPGLMVVLCQTMATTLAATAIVRQKETGTLEQLFLTPVRSWELVIGKMAPYLVLVLARVEINRPVPSIVSAPPKLLGDAALWSTPKLFCC